MAKTNDQVIRAFFKGEKAKSGSMKSTGDKLYSYRTVIIQRFNGRTIGNITKYSRTTSIQQNNARVRDTNFIANKVPMGTDDLTKFIINN